MSCHAPCPAYATCHGGATLVPLEGFWHSAAVSDTLVACPNPDACQGDRASLRACQEASHNQISAAAKLQVIFFRGC